MCDFICSICFLLINLLSMLIRHNQQFFITKLRTYHDMMCIHMEIKGRTVYLMGIPSNTSSASLMLQWSGGGGCYQGCECWCRWSGCHGRRPLHLGAW
jgi:hypothetical protein